MKQEESYLVIEYINICGCVVEIPPIVFYFNEGSNWWYVN